MTDAQTLQVRGKREVDEEQTRPGPVFRPDIDIVESPECYFVYADIPGADEKSISVRLDGGELKLQADLASGPQSGWKPLHTEFEFGSYRRKFRISDQINEQLVAAKITNGVLELRLPKSAESQPRSIPVLAG